MRALSAERSISAVAMIAILVSLIREKATIPQITVEIMTSNAVLFDRADAARCASNSIDNFVFLKTGSLMTRLKARRTKD
jgi:hypothetical protein